MNKIIGVLGLGVFGSTIAKELGEHYFDVIAVDRDLMDVNRVEEYVVQGVQGDITDLDLLKSIGFEKCDTVVIGTGSNLESSVLAVLNCKKLGIKKIIAKAKNKVHKEILLEVGAHEIIRPEKEMGDRVARNLMRNKILDVIELDEDNAIIEFLTPKEWVGKSLVQLDLRNKYGINVIGMKNAEGEKLQVNVLPDEKISPKSLLVAIGEPHTFEHLDYTNQLK
ncbi:TrkA family potassium uptake protein [Marinilactibacillus sp. XAAS-LB27]|uniref:potassium channel family protein n=1 Tax=Marinilactibacillus sp. XAAS-LB27 TaxID=3114538 RepID=UPI002E18A069|nr:TrkA family potassium uptake protein [Marinilactibacillus sp. XAAS-LB27]